MCSGVARWYSPHGPLALDELAEHYAELVSRALGCTSPPGVADLRRCREIVAREWGVAVQPAEGTGVGPDQAARESVAKEWGMSV
jgi:hypothetical protein